MKLIDLDTEKKKIKAEKRKKAKAKNEPEIKYRDSDGTYYKFSVTYQFKRKNWTFEIWAKSQKEAEARVQNIKMFPCDINQVHMEIPL